MPRPVSDLAHRLDGGARTMELHDEARRRRAAGSDVILLTVGDTDLDSPAAAGEAALRALSAGRTHYPDRTGEPALRAAIAARQAESCGTPCGAHQVLVTAGAQQAVFLSLLSLVGPGDEVLLLDPYYAHHASAIRACGGVPVTVPLSPDDGFRIRPEAIERAVGPSTKAFLFNAPHNPTGRVFDVAETDAVAAVCRRHDLWVISDEVYAGLRFSGTWTPPSSLPGMASRTVSIGSFSKSHAMTGWRVGWTVSPPALAPHLARVSACSSLGVAPFAQDAALAALAACTLGIRHELDARRGVVADALADVPGVRAIKPESGPFFLLDARGTGLTGVEFCWGLLDATGVALMPGEVFGDGGYGHARMSLAVGGDRLLEACHRIRDHVVGLDCDREDSAVLTLS